MSDQARRLAYVYDGWDGYHLSLIRAIEELSPEQFAFRASDSMRSVGELAWHIADGRVDWFQRINPQACQELLAEIENRGGKPPLTYDGADVAAWHERTWQMVASTLNLWTVDDLPESYNHSYQNNVYAVSRQWTIWRIMAHDIHHGGQLSELLGMQGIFPLELTLLGGHLTEPPLVG